MIGSIKFNNISPAKINAPQRACSFKGSSEPMSMKADNSDYFDKDSHYQETITMMKYSDYKVHLLGKLDGKDYNLLYKCNDPRHTKNVEIQGYYDHKRTNIKALYKNKKHHYYKGTWGDKEFELEHRIGGVFINGYLKGKIDGKDFYAKFPSISATDNNRDLIVLLLHASGYAAHVDGHNFSYAEASETCYDYYDGGKYANLGLYTLFDDIWNDPIPTGPNPFNQV